MRMAPLCLALFVVASAYADDKKPSYEVEVRKDISYHAGKDADSVRHKLDLYLPKGAKDYPVFFFIHGGGWTKGRKDSFGAIGKTFASNGIGFVAINYRLTPTVKHPDHTKDVAEAFAWVVANLGKDGADTKRIFVGGHSAGGHLAALLGTDESYLKAHKLGLSNIKGVIPISGVFDVSHSRMSRAFGEEDSRKAASPMSHLGDKMPPFLVFYADKELGALGKQAEAFGKAVKAKNGKIEVKMIKDRDHGTIMRNVAKPDDEVTKAIFAFIRAK
jgi:arylformamidase